MMPTTSKLEKRARFVAQGDVYSRRAGRWLRCVLVLTKFNIFVYTREDPKHEMLRVNLEDAGLVTWKNRTVTVSLPDRKKRDERKTGAPEKRLMMRFRNRDVARKWKDILYSTSVHVFKAKRDASPDCEE